jgi:hypothetical protein
MTKPVELNRMDPATGYARLSNPPRDRQETPEEQRTRLFWLFMFGQQLAWQAGDTLAIARAIATCRILHRPPPLWLANAIVAFVDIRMPAAERKQQDALWIHMLRWKIVKKMRAQLCGRLDWFEHKIKRRIEQYSDAHGMLSWDKCWRAVSEILTGTEAGGGGETMRASYKLIQNAGGERTTLESYRLALQRRDRHDSNK